MIKNQPVNHKPFNTQIPTQEIGQQDKIDLKKYSYYDSTGKGLYLMKMNKNIILILFFWVFSSQSLALSSWQEPEFIKKSFIEIALKNEYKQTDMKVVKWYQPIKYTFIYEHLQQNDLIEKLTHAHMRHLSQITNHPISQANNQQANLKIVLTRDEFFKNTIAKHGDASQKHLSLKSNCIAFFNRNNKYQITQATVIIPVDHAMSRGLLPACIAEETTQAMGLPNDSDWVHPSIANDASKLDLLTGLDYLMLKILYDKRLKTGMNLVDTKQQVKIIIADLEKNNTIKNAPKNVKKGGLHLFFR